MTTLQNFYDYQDNKNYSFMTETDMENLREYFKTKKSFDEFKKTITANYPKAFTKGACKRYYTDSVFENLGKCLQNFKDNNEQSSSQWFSNDFAPNFDKEKIKDFYDADNEYIFI